MKKIVHIITLLISVNTIAQPYGNEWINYSQKYFKIPIFEEGIYRISYYDFNKALESINEHISNINPKNIQIFGKGKEQYIYVEGEKDGVFNVSDFIEFFAQPNDGWFDSLVYENPNDRNNPYYSLFNDTAFYFITWNTSSDNRRMNIETDVYFSGLSSAPYFYKEIISQWTGTYYNGSTDANKKTEVSYTAGEGWMDGYFGYFEYLKYKIKKISTPNAYTGSNAPNASVTTVVAGVSNASQNPDHHLQIKYGNSPTIAIDDKFNGYALKKYNFTIPANEIGTTTSLKFESAPLSPAPTTDKMAISYVYMKYAHNYDFSGENATTYTLTIPTSQTSKTYIYATNFSSSSLSHIYDLTGHSRIDVVQIGSNIKALIPKGGEKNIYFITDDQIKTAFNIVAAGNNGTFTDYPNMEKDSAYIIISHPSIWKEAKNYALYRDSTGYNVVLANINELYEQFSYGINKHPFAIRGFCDFLLDKWNTPPKYLFLLGKSIVANKYRNNANNYSRTLVPSFGYPASDISLIAGLNGTTLDPPILIGRLSAKNDSDVTIYLNKIREYEDNQEILPSFNMQTLEKKEWMKNVLHFCGGGDINQNNQFCGYLRQYENIIEGEHYGGSVTTFSKNSTAPIEQNATDYIKELINKGVSLITFFGHSAGSSFDISLDDPKNYRNKGKYFTLIANGCYSGNIHEPISSVLSTSEQFVLVEDKAAIAFISTVDQGYVSPLNSYTSELYNNIGIKNYNKSIGKCMQETIKTIQNPNNYYIKSVCLEMTLHGDPAIIVNTHSLPDYVITNDLTLTPQYFFTPSAITTEVDSFDLNIIITNIGKAIQDSLSVDVTRDFPGDIPSVTYYKTIPAPYYKDTIAIRMPVDIAHGIGLNKFDIWVDNVQYNKIIEIEDEKNNHLDVEVRINSTDLIPIYPYNYAVIPNTNVILKASTSDPFTPAKKYQFQIDTTDLYNSPIIKDTIIYSSGGVLTWTPLLPITTDSIVYYWRTSPYDALDTTVFSWREHSFQYIPNKRGWGQAHFFQFKKDEYNFIDYDRKNRNYDFIQSPKQLTCINIGNPNSVEIPTIEYRIDNVLQYSWVALSLPMLYVAVIDSLSAKAWGEYCKNASTTYNTDYNFGHYNDVCKEPRKIFVFRIAVKEEMDSLREMLNNKVPNGNYVLVYTGVRGEFQNTAYWDSSHFAAFESLGADSIRYVDSNVPYIFFAQKGNPTSAIEKIGTHSRAKIELNASIPHNWYQGTITSTLIGPAKKWGSLHWRQHPYQNNGKDDVNLYVIGIKANGQEEIVKTFSYDTTDILNLYDYVDAKEYPFLKLKVDIQDNILNTSAQMDRWQVLYESVPEAAINPLISYTFIDDSLQEGKEVLLSVAIQNISEYDMDSLRVAYWITENNQQVHAIPYPKQDSLRAGQVLIDTVSYSTIGLSSLNSLWVEVNPMDSLWQLEQYHFNNIARINFLVEKDKINPLLDVTFDGIHILDGDIVSPKTNIVIKLKDENLFLALDDTSDFEVFMTDPNGAQKKILFTESNGKEVMKFTPAVLPNNSCKIEYQTDFKKDGTYQLTVRGRDKSKNVSGDIDYNISFEVISKSTITQVLNYPNPFTTSTRFVFTLTGEEIPDYFKIQILTITGKVVREITQDELGTLNIGRNITQFAWDGTDEFGDRLANGVYLYRVITKIKGEEIERLSTEADQYFNKEFGKMFLMR